MQELRLVAVSEDGTYLVLATAGRGTRFTLPVDDRLRAAVRGNFSRLGQYEIEVESPLRPKEIQARIRAGESAEQIAATAGIPVERVRWFEGPVLQEREYVAQQAQRIIVRLPGESTPGPTLGELVAERLTRRGVPADEIDWDSCKRDDNLWRVKLGFVWNGHTRHAEWLFDPRRRHITPNDDEAMRLSAADHGETSAREKAQDDTVRPFVPRLAPKLASVPSLPPDAPAAARSESSVRHEPPARHEQPAARREPPAAWQHEPPVRHEPRVEPPAAFRSDLTPVPFRLPDPLAGLDAATLEDRDAREWNSRVRDSHGHEAHGRDSHGHEAHGRDSHGRDSQGRKETADRGSAVIGLPRVAQAGHDEPGLGPRPPDAAPGAGVHAETTADDAAAPPPEDSVRRPDATPEPAASVSEADTSTAAQPTAVTEPPAPAKPATAEAASEKNEPAAETPTPAAERPAEPVTVQRTPETAPVAADTPASGEPASAASDSADKAAATTNPGPDKAAAERPAPAPAPKPAAAAVPATDRPAAPAGPPPRPKPRPRPTVPAARPASDAPAASAAAVGTPGTPQKKEPAADAKTELPAPPVPKPRPRKSRRRASVPSWDEIMFGARKPD
ncbi:septation protein SepH [Sphaerimonospora sp. CA-214678]|uniref:septation protein SepH n=1 Tax=Sphaerimonospora sp. CA-214678 TaxID=3240029 RepID=UPI003D904332